MRKPESIVEHSERVTSIFGHWPSFHDAEVMEVHLWRGDVDPDRNRYVFPVLTVKLHVFAWMDETDAQGQLVSRNHTLVTLRFHDVAQGLQLVDFNHENALLGLNIARCERDGGPSPCLEVEFMPSFGMGAAFTCHRVEVRDVEACDERGAPRGS